MGGYEQADASIKLFHLNYLLVRCLLGVPTFEMLPQALDIFTTAVNKFNVFVACTVVKSLLSLVVSETAKLLLSSHIMSIDICFGSRWRSDMNAGFARSRRNASSATILRRRRAKCRDHPVCPGVRVEDQARCPAQPCPEPRCFAD